MSTPDDRELEAAIASLAEHERGGFPVSAVAATWRFAGIVHIAEVNAWLSVGVFDGHRAGILKLAGFRPDDLAELPRIRERAVGFAFAIGQLSLAEVRRLVELWKVEMPYINPDVSQVMSKVPPDPPSSDTGTGTGTDGGGDEG